MSKKVFGLILAAAALLGLGVMSAAADTGGHFTSEVHSTTIVGTESGEKHQLHFQREGSAPEQRIGCLEDSYHGTVTGTTVTEIKITPSWSTCKTTEEGATHFEIHENGCYFLFTIGDDVNATHHTVDLVCPTKPIEITHPNCNITVPTQTVVGAVYTEETIGGKKAITLDVTAKDIKSEYHEKICVFLGTNQESEMNGSVTVQGFIPNSDEPVDITATTTTP